MLRPPKTSHDRNAVLSRRQKQSSRPQLGDKPGRSYRHATPPQLTVPPTRAAAALPSAIGVPDVDFIRGAVASSRRARPRVDAPAWHVERRGAMIPRVSFPPILLKKSGGG